MKNKKQTEIDFYLLKSFKVSACKIVVPERNKVFLYFIAEFLLKSDISFIALIEVLLNFDRSFIKFSNTC